MSNISRLEVASAAGGRVREITLSHPPANVMDLQMMDELLVELERLQGVDVVLLRGAGKHFSAGVDVADHTPDRVERMITCFHRIFRMLAAGDAVTVAAVQGVALGGGMELALAADFCLVADECRLGLPEIKLGVFPPLAAAWFPGRFGDRAITELVLLGEQIQGPRALELGLVHRSVPRAALEETTRSIVDALLCHSGAALRHARRALAIGRGHGDALDAVERLYLDQLMATRDAVEGLAAFVEKRPPAWSHS